MRLSPFLCSCSCELIAMLSRVTQHRHLRSGIQVHSLSLSLTLSLHQNTNQVQMAPSLSLFLRSLPPSFLPHPSVSLSPLALSLCCLSVSLSCSLSLLSQNTDQVHKRTTLTLLCRYCSFVCLSELWWTNSVDIGCCEPSKGGLPHVECAQILPASLRFVVHGVNAVSNA